MATIDKILNGTPVPLTKEQGDAVKLILTNENFLSACVLVVHDLQYMWSGSIASLNLLSEAPALEHALRIQGKYHGMIEFLEALERLTEKEEEDV